MSDLFSMRPAGLFLLSCSLAIDPQSILLQELVTPLRQDVTFAFAELPDFAVGHLFSPSKSLSTAALTIAADSAMYKKHQIKKIHWLNV